MSEIMKTNSDYIPLYKILKTRTLISLFSRDYRIDIHTLMHFHKCMGNEVLSGV